jgi:hypothetical protein
MGNVKAAAVARKGSSNGSSPTLYTAAGFTKANKKAIRRLIFAIDGPEKSGKTNFVLTMPEPVAVINTDIGLDGVVQRWQDDKDIWVLDVDVSLQDLKTLTPRDAAQEADKAWRKILKAYRDVLGEAKSVVFDNATECWEILRMARFGKLDQVKPHHYGPVNAEYRDLIRSSYDQGVTNLGLIHKIKDEYTDDKRTGRRVRAGFSDTGFLVQANLSCWRETGKDAAAFPDNFHVDVIDCRQNMEIAGMSLTGADAAFPQLAALVFPDSKPEDWL